MKTQHEKLRHRIIYRLMHLVSPMLLKKYDFQTDKMGDIDGPYIIMANHLTEVDMLMMAAAFRKHMYFVAGEHLIRSKHGRLIVWGQDPIFEYKGAVALDTAREIVKRVKRGSNICIFPEGSRSFNGETLTLPESASKLVKAAGCSLITYHIEGGYFVAPRWAYTFRTGPMKGRIVNIYPSEDIRAMSNSELACAINRDIYENAYETQREHMYPYKGERLAEGLENYLIKCSCCGAFDSMVSEDDRFRCTECGQEGIYTEEGFLKGESLRFDNVYDWGKWSEQETEAYIDAADPAAPVFSDRDVLMYEITADHEQKDIARGTLTGFRDHFEFEGQILEFSDIPAMDMLYYGKTLLFTYKKQHLGITGEHYHAIKYNKLYLNYKSGRKS